MRVAIFGLGYVGSVTAACLAKAGHHVIGVDINDNKRALIRNGKPPVAETHLDHLFRDNVATGHLRITDKGEEAVRESDISMICVGTPSRRNGGLDVEYVKRVCTEIGTSLKRRRDFHVVAVRSTVLPGTVRGLLKPILESASGKRAGSDFGLCSNPEFLREGTAVADFHRPPRTLIGAYDDRSGTILSQLYSGVEAPLFVTHHQCRRTAARGVQAPHQDPDRPAVAGDPRHAHRLCVGIIARQEGIDSLLEAARIIVHERGRSDVHFTIIGPGPDLPRMRNWQRNWRSTRT